MLIFENSIALFGVMTPGVGNFRLHTLVLAKALAAHSAVTIVAENETVAQLSGDEAAYLDGWPVDVMSVGRFEASEPPHVRVYQMGNNPPHRWILEAFAVRQGIVLLHDPSLFWLLKGTPFFCDFYLERESGLVHCDAATHWINRPEMNELDLCLAHMIYFNRIVAEYAHGVIVHSRFAADQIRAKVPGRPVAHLPLILNTLCPDVDLALASLWSKAAAQRSVPRFGVFGYMTHHKRIAEIVEAMERLSQIERFELILAGRWEGPLIERLRPLLDRLVASGHAVVRDEFLDRDEMLRMMVECDYVIGMRYPTAGESSGIATECNALGVPIVFNPFSGFTDVDASFNIPVPIDAGAEAFATVLSGLCKGEMSERRAERARRIAEARTAYDHDFVAYGTTAAAAIAEVVATHPKPSYDIRRIARQGSGDVPTMPVRVVFSDGHRATFHPDGSLDVFADFIAEFETIRRAHGLSEAIAADEGAGHVVHLGKGSEPPVPLERSTASTDPLAAARTAELIAEGDTLLIDLMTAVVDIPVFGRLFLRRSLIDRIVAAVDAANEGDFVYSLLRRDRDDDQGRDLVLRGLGFRIDGHTRTGLLVAVRRSHVVERFLLERRALGDRSQPLYVGRRRRPSTTGAFARSEL